MRLPAAHRGATGGVTSTAAWCGHSDQQGESMQGIEPRSATTRPLRCAAALASVAWLFLPPLALAQNQQPTGGTETGPRTEAPALQGRSPSSAVSDRQLDETAAAIRQVTTVKQNYAPRIAAAPPSGKERVIGEANNALVKAVTDQGLTVDEYNAILLRSETDDGLRQRLVERIRSTGH
jgi:Domain of unknown function (DUF4168)